MNSVICLGARRGYIFEKCQFGNVDALSGLGNLVVRTVYQYVYECVSSCEVELEMYERFPDGVGEVRLLVKPDGGTVESREFYISENKICFGCAPDEHGIAELIF